jgi:hypothetical protein
MHKTITSEGRGQKNPVELAVTYRSTLALSQGWRDPNFAHRNGTILMLRMTRGIADDVGNRYCAAH